MKKLTLHIIMFVVALVISPISQATLINEIKGVWHGTGTHNKVNWWSIKITMTPQEYLIEYPSSSCGGKLKLLNSTTKSVSFREIMTFGDCINKGRVELHFEDINTLKYRYYDKNNALRAIGEVKCHGCKTLLEARKGFKTKLILDQFKPDGKAPVSPSGLFELIEYPSAVGRLAAYITPAPKDGKKHSAIIWAHGGFGGIGESTWEDDRYTKAFRDADLVVMVPSWRGENDNPGQFELFYGEVNDAMAAIEYLSQLPYVDPERIYFAGHSTGGTIALLVAEASDKVRVAFSFGGAPDIYAVVRDGRGYGNTPFNYRIKKESFLRSPLNFIATLQNSTFYFEGSNIHFTLSNEIKRMTKIATDSNSPFQAFIVEGGNHFNILEPLNKLIAEKIINDRGKVSNITFSESEVQQQFDNWIQEIKKIKAIFPIPDTFCRTVTQIPLLECQALIDFYNNTNGKEWKDRLEDKWGVTNRPCQWEGIKCHAGHVIALRLTEKKITGTIPESIGDLEHLTSLELSKNNLTGTLPKSLGNLTQLTSLSLGYNQLNGTIPDSIGNLSQLKILNLKKNQLSGTIPKSIGNLSQLKILNLRNNQLSGTIPKSIGNLSQLKEIYLYNNQLSGSIPDSIGHLSQLEAIYLYNNQLSGVLPKSMSQLMQLKDIFLNNNQLNGPLPKSIDNWLQLEELNLSSNNFNGTIPTSIGKLSQAKIDLSNNQQLSGPICLAVTEIPQTECKALVEISQLSLDKLKKKKRWNKTNQPCQWGGILCSNGHVIELKLSNSLLKGNIPKSLGNLSHLEDLYLDNNQLTGPIPEVISQLSKLEKLYLNNNQLSDTIPESIGNLTHLKQLYLNNNQLSGSIPESIGNLKLGSLHLHENALCGKVPLSLMNLKYLYGNGLSLKNNHLTSSNQELSNWLNRHLFYNDGQWETSQTICPQKVWLMILVILVLAIGIVIATIKTPMVWKKRFMILLQKTFSILGVSVWKLFSILGVFTQKLFGIYMIMLGILSIITPIVHLIKNPSSITNQHSVMTFLIGSVVTILFSAAFVFVGYHLIRYGYMLIRGLENHSIKAHWKGDARLVSAFWGFGIIGTLILPILISLFFGLFINPLLGLFGINVSASFALSEVGLVFLILGIYSVFVVVSIWRCAWNTNNQIWGYLARFFVIIKVILLSWIILGGAFIPLIINVLK